MRRSNQFIRQSGKFSSLLLFAIAAHALAGGSFVSARESLSLIALISIFQFLTQQIVAEGPALALEILLIQSFSHFILGGGDSGAQLRMPLSHLSAGLVSYISITYFEKFLEFFESVLQSLLTPNIRYLLPQVAGNNRISNSYGAELHEVVGISEQKFRGPPITSEVKNAA